MLEFCHLGQDVRRDIDNRHPADPGVRGVRGAARGVEAAFVARGRCDTHSDGRRQSIAYRRRYFAGIACFMVPHGIQSVLLPYLLAIELQQQAQRFGVTLMLSQLPMLLLPFGGLVADRLNARRLLIGLQAAGLIVPLLLVAALWHGAVTEWLVMLYVLSWGLAGAFATPARDGLLRSVAGGNIQRMVTQATGILFATQIVGNLVAGAASRVGAIAVVLMQCAELVIGVLVSARRLALRGQSPTADRGSFGHELGGSAPAITFAPIVSDGARNLEQHWRDHASGWRAKARPRIVHCPVRP